MRQINRFLSIGALATAAHLAVALALDAALEIGPLFAKLCGFATAVLMSYVGHTRVTFDIGVRRAVHFPRFVLVSGLGLTLSSTSAWLSVEKLGLSFTVAMLAVAALVPALTFLILKHWALKG